MLSLSQPPPPTHTCAHLIRRWIKQREMNTTGCNRFVKGWICSEEKVRRSWPRQRRVHQRQSVCDLCTVAGSPRRLSSFVLLVDPVSLKMTIELHNKLTGKYETEATNSKRKNIYIYILNWCYFCCSVSTVHWSHVLFPLWLEVGCKSFCIWANQRGTMSLNRQGCALAVQWIDLTQLLGGTSG